MTDRELYRKVNFRENFDSYLQIAKPYSGLFVAILVVVVFIQLLVLSEKYLFKVILDNGGAFVAGTIAKNIFLNVLFIVAATYLGVVVFRILTRWLRLTLVNILESKMIFDLKKKFFNHIIHLSHGFHTTHKTGSMISKLGRGAGAFENMTDFLLFNVSSLVIQMIIVGGSLLLLDWQAGVVVFVVAIVFVAFGLLVAKGRKPVHIAANDADDREKGTLADVLTNIDSVHYFGKEDFVKDKYRELADETRAKKLRYWNYDRIFNAGSALIVGTGTFFVIYFSLMKFVNGEISLGTLAFVYTVYVGLMDLLGNFVDGIRGFYIALGDFDALFSYEKIKNDIVDAPHAKNLHVEKGEVELKNVTFTYGGRHDAAVRNFNLKIKPNEKVAFVGHSGCGKTTLVKLLYRLYDVQKGDIFIDGKNIDSVTQESLRNELSIVPQEAILFDDTIYNNILFSNPNSTRAEVLKAIKFAQLDAFVDRLPRKENTIVGERGVKLSGGEKQRVSIARAILANKKILVLDEATSALDSQTEHAIQKDLWRLMQGRTAIIIAHRLSTVMRADKIVVMDKGKIVQIGTHHELIGKKGIYQELWNLQKGGYNGE